MIGRLCERNQKRKWIAAIGLALMLFTVAWARAQSDLRNDSVFAGTEEFAKGATKTTEVNLDKNMLNMAGKSFDGSAHGPKAALVKGLDSVYVREYDYAKPGQYSMADVQKYSMRLDSGGWIHMIRERSAAVSTDICFRGGDDGEPAELVIIDAEPDKLTFVHLKGHISADELSKLGRDFGAPKLQTRSH